MATILPLCTWDKKLLYEDPQGTNESSKGQHEAHKEPRPGSPLSQAALCVGVSCHLACRHSVDPAGAQ